ncbi:MAG: hypothetical protein QOF79_1864 [Actinomycetota bacterium]|jgi:MFS family permease|nr:hypothetical protein [Actinomycetota bacterium]
MGATAKLFWILTAFCFASAATYIIWNLADKEFGGKVEPVGTVALLLVGLLSALIAFYVGRVHSGQGGELPEDRVDANIDDGEAEQGFFSPWSWWPIMLGASTALMFLGLAVGNWLCFIAVALAAVSLVGLTYEYHRGYHAH